MRRSPILAYLFRFLLVLAVVCVCLNVPARIQTILLALSGGVGLWLFSALCLDAKAIRAALEESQKESVQIQGFQPVRMGPKSGASPPLMEGFSLRKLGDRLFKADESKTCKSCQSFEAEGPVCRLDEESLVGITVSAVGCQHWTPGLKVAGGPSEEAQ